MLEDHLSSGEYVVLYRGEGGGTCYGEVFRLLGTKGLLLSAMLLRERVYILDILQKRATFQAFYFVKGSKFFTFYSEFSPFVNFTPATQRVRAFLPSIPVWFGPECPPRCLVIENYDHFGLKSHFTVIF